MTAFHSPADIASLLEIKESTLRKYALMLEKIGYTFQKNAQNQRWYSDTDILVFKKVIALKDSADMTLKDSIEAAFLWSKGELVAQDETVIHSAITLQGESDPRDIAHITQSLDELKEIVLQQNEKIEQLTRIVLEQQHYINNELEVLKIAQLEEAEEVAASTIEQKEDPQPQEQTKKGFFSRLFGR